MEEYRPFESCKELIEHWRKIWRDRFCDDYSYKLSMEMPSIWVVNKDSGIREMIIGYGENVVFLPRVNLTMQDLFNEYTFINGSPCGVLV
jgi:hypothetical protein